MEFENGKISSGLHEECGVFGVYDLEGNDVATTIYYGLFALQHRGQESCGIAVSDTNGPLGKVRSHKGMGLVSEVIAHEPSAARDISHRFTSCPPICRQTDGIHQMVLDQ